MAGKSVVCPVCHVALPADSTICPDCGEDLAALVHLQLRSTILYNKALALNQVGDHDSATGALLESIAADGRNTSAMLVLGKIYAQTGRTAEARAIWEKARSLAPEDARLDTCLASLPTPDDHRGEPASTPIPIAPSRPGRSPWLAFAASAGTLLLGAVVVFLLPWMGINWGPAASLPANPNVVVAAASPSPTATSSPVPTVATPTAVPSPTASAVLPAASATATPTPLSLVEPVTPDLLPAASTALQGNEQLQGLQITAKQEGSTIRLSGEVPDLATRYLVERTVRGVAGVELVDTAGLTITRVYVVESGDSLWSIALAVYDQPERWLDIAEKNGLRAPYRLTIGQRLTLPELPF